MEQQALLDMLKSGVHFGHQAKNWHPKMKPFIFTTRGGVHIIDLEKTAAQLSLAMTFVSDLAARGGTILFVTTKRQATAIVKKAAEVSGMPAVTERWIGGTLTNFENILSLVHRLKDLRRQRDTGELEKYTKRERLKKEEEIANLEKSVGGIEGLEKLPDAVFIIDLKKERTAVREARKRKIPIVAIVDTNANPDLVDYAIPGNDDASKSISMLTNAVAQAVQEGVARRAKEQAAPAAPQTK
ncbi:MAG: 30S ribosomal protein S2 [Candidatus Kerfeldbacteria bacterium]|nr:30S ribosomal protein S2 [Candidatus Kerfeldbacteria bacterium]